jgi:hypothetical protein
MVRPPLGVGLALGVEVEVASAVGLAVVGEFVVAGELVGADCSVTSGFTSGRAKGRVGVAGFRL